MAWDGLGIAKFRTGDGVGTDAMVGVEEIKVRSVGTLGIDANDGELVGALLGGGTT